MKKLSMIIKKERGAALVICMVFLTLLSVLGAAGIMTSSTDVKIASNDLSTSESFYIAEAGLARAQAEVLNDLQNDNIASNNTFYSLSGLTTITPSSSAFYNFTSVSFAGGSYQLSVKFYDAPGGGLDPKKVMVRSTGVGPDWSTTVLECSYFAENISVWNNAIFGGGGGGAIPITGSVIIAGSVHLLGNGVPATSYTFVNQTGLVLNDNTGMEPVTLLPTVNAADITSDLGAKFRLRNGRVDMRLGSSTLGSLASPLAAIYIMDGADSDSNGVNDDIDGGVNILANGQNVFADEGAYSAEAYDLGNVGLSLPPISVVGAYDLTAVTESDGAPAPKGLINGNLELTGEYKDGPTWYYPNINQSDGFGNFIIFDSTTNVLQIGGVVMVNSLNISDDITYTGIGTIYSLGTAAIGGNVLPGAANSYPITNCIGVISVGDMSIGGVAKVFLTGAYYSAAKITSDKQSQLAGTIVCQRFDITLNVPKIWQIQSLTDNLPPQMPGEGYIWTITAKNWRQDTM
jgi:hypothetical protein